MDCFYRKIRGKQVYIYRVKTDENGNRIHEYIGNINNLPDDIAHTVNNYFSVSNHKKNFINDNNYDLLTRNTISCVNKKFGDMWLIYEIEKNINLVSLIDEKLVKRFRNDGLSVGHFFLFAAINRILHPVSKNKMSEWLHEYDINNIFGSEIDVGKLTSNNYHKKWSSIKKEDIYDIANKFFLKCYNFAPGKDVDSASSFDTTNYYLFMATETESELAKRGKNKQGRDNLRQVGLSLLVDNQTSLILHHKVYQGNKHDSKLFYEIINDMIAQARKYGKKYLIVVFDDGMNSKDNILILDKMEGVYFITSYSTSDAKYLMSIDLNRYTVIDCEHNRMIDNEKILHPDKSDYLESKKVIAYHFRYIFWGKERNVVLLYNHDTAKKQRLLFDKRLNHVRDWLKEAKINVKNKAPYYRTKESIIKLYNGIAKKYHLSPDVFELNFSEKNGLELNFRKRDIFVNDYIKKLGKSILISNNLNFSCEKIVQLHFDKNVVENAFRQCKDDECCSVWPIYHWTDTMIECHIFSSLVSYSYLKLIELIMKNNGIEKTGKYVINKMSQVCSQKISLILPNLIKKEYLTLSNIDEFHMAIFSIFNYTYIDNKLYNQCDIHLE